MSSPLPKLLPTPTSIRRRRALQWALSSCAIALPGLSARAQGAAGDYPNRPITLVVGYPPGGSTDLTARTVGAELSRRLGQPVVIENVGGSGGTIGADRVRQAAPDGHTLLLGANNEMAIARLINARVRYDPVADFTPVGLVASQPMVLVASTASGLKSLDQMITAAKAQPGRFSFGSSGVGTALHLAGEMVKESAGLFMVHIPYRGVAPLTNDLVGGQLELGVFVLSSGLPHIRAGRVTALGITETRRSAVAPEIAPLADHPALKRVDISSWFGLWGPAQLPAPVLTRLRQALADTLSTPDVRRRLQDSGASFFGADETLGAYQQRAIAQYQRIVRFANIKE